MIVRPFEQGDIASLGVIAEKAFGAAWTREMLETDIANEQAHYLCAVTDDGKIAGYIGYWQVLDEGHVMTVAVDEDCRRQGIGEAVVREMIRTGYERGILYWTLEVRVGNTRAVRLYEKCGFELAGIRPRYYSDPVEDAGIYWLKTGA